MTEPLERPIWHALKTRHAAFAEGGPRALRFTPDISPFAAASDDEPDSLGDLAALIPESQTVILLQAGEIPIPLTAAVEFSGAGVQMVAKSVVPAELEAPVQQLSEADAPDMLALATLTKPGPFLPRTHLLGDFFGIRIDGRLVAMAGERLKVPGFTEVSAVCTHPDFRGRGYAGLLSRIVATRIFKRGETPFLHAWANNTPAIRLYEELGFMHRRDMSATLLRRA